MIKESGFNYKRRLDFFPLIELIFQKFEIIVTFLMILTAYENARRIQWYAERAQEKILDPWTLKKK